MDVKTCVTLFYIILNMFFGICFNPPCTLTIKVIGLIFFSKIGYEHVF